MAATGVALPPDIAAEDKGPAILAACIGVTVLSTIFVAARLFVRGRIIGKMYLDDYFMAASMVRASGQRLSLPNTNTASFRSVAGLRSP